MKKVKKGTSNNVHLQGNILGINIDSTSINRVLRKVQVYISKAKKFYIVTPNPEIVTEAQKDELLTRILNLATISIPDGIGLIQAEKFLRLPNPKAPVKRLLTLIIQGLAVGFLTIVDRKKLTKNFNSISGRKMFMELIKLANKKKWRVFLLGGEKGEVDGTRRELERTFKSVAIRSFAGPVLNENGEPIAKTDSELERKAVKMINEFKPQLLFVGFGAPKQEKWMHRWYKKLSIGGAMVVGGTFKYISGRKKLPPKWIEERGLEWLWRLFTGNQKPKRIFTAFPTFPLRIFWEKWKS